MENTCEIEFVTVSKERLRKMRNVKCLSIGGSKCEDNVDTDDFKKLENVTELEIINCKGFLLTAMKCLNNVKILTCEPRFLTCCDNHPYCDNTINIDVSEYFNNVESLSLLFIDNFFDQKIMNVIKKLPKLQELYLYKNPFTRKLIHPSNILYLKNLRFLYFDDQCEPHFFKNFRHLYKIACQLSYKHEAKDYENVLNNNDDNNTFITIPTKDANIVEFWRADKISEDSFARELWSIPYDGHECFHYEWL
jgi:hypothetical protein